MTIQKLIIELKELGMTDAEIGVEVGASQSIISRLRTGKHKTTSYERGEAIKKLVLKKRQNIYNKNDPIQHHPIVNTN